ncbi:MAG: hypothetical protein ACLTZT_00320 [Butyricimonas faecalis]
MSVEKSSQAVIVEVKFALAQMFASMNGRAGEDREFALKIQLSGEVKLITSRMKAGGRKTSVFPFTVACRICSGTGVYQRITLMITRVILK